MKTCLLVDDSRAIRAIVRPILANLGFHVIEAADGAEALKVCQAQLPTAVLLDWNMPVMNGLELVTSMRSAPQWQQTPVLMITTMAERDDILKAMQAGVTNYIVKPFDAATLKKKIDQIAVVS